jgi:hypothetical protein
MLFELYFLQQLSAATPGGCFTVIHNGHGTGHAGETHRPRSRVSRGVSPASTPSFSLTFFKGRLQRLREDIRHQF